MIVEKRKIFLITSLFYILIGLVIVFSFGLKQGIDLKGGVSWQVQGNFSEQVLRNFFRKDYPNVVIKSVGNNQFSIRLPSISEEQHQNYLTGLKKYGIKEISFENISPFIGTELRRKSLWAFFYGLVLIILYLAYSFRKTSWKINSFRYGLVSITCLIHDVIIPIVVMSLLGKFMSIEIDTKFIVALLFIIGYSVNNTIVVFDRIREKISNGNIKDITAIVNSSIKDSLARALNTSLTTFFVILPIIFIGPASLKYFVLTLTIGLFVGTYSSLILAPCLVYKKMV